MARYYKELRKVKDYQTFKDIVDNLCDGYDWAMQAAIIRCFVEDAPRCYGMKVSVEDINKFADKYYEDRISLPEQLKGYLTKDTNLSF